VHRYLGWVKLPGIKLKYSKIIYILNCC
jgi:hypothetical protein